MTITATNGGQFSLSSLLLGSNEPAVAGEATDAVLINGTRLAITNTASLYTVNTGNTFAVKISGLVNGGYVSIDNLTYQVPEPASLAMLAIGLAGMTAVSRRKRRS